MNAINNLAKNLRKYRMAQYLSQEALANMAGIEYSEVSRLIRCMLNTSISVIFALAAALHIDPRQLIEQE